MYKVLFILFILSGCKENENKSSHIQKEKKTSLYDTIPENIKPVDSITDGGIFDSFLNNPKDTSTLAAQGIPHPDILETVYPEN